MNESKCSIHRQSQPCLHDGCAGELGRILDRISHIRQAQIAVHLHRCRSHADNSRPGKRLSDLLCVDEK